MFLNVKEYLKDSESGIYDNACHSSMAGAWGIVDGTELEPAPGNNARHREDLKDSKKRSQLTLVIADLVMGLQSYVQGKTSPSDMWASLVAHMDVMQNENGPTLMRQRFHGEKLKYILPELQNSYQNRLGR